MTKPTIMLRRASDGEYMAGSPCREMLISSMAAKTLRGPCIIYVDKPFHRRVDSTNRVISQFIQDREPITTSKTGLVVLPDWICYRLPLLHAVLGFLRSPIPSHRLQLMATAHLLSNFRYVASEVETLNFNGAQTFCLHAHPDIWTPLVANYLDGLKSPNYTMRQLDPKFLSVVLFNEGIVTLDDVMEYVKARYRLESVDIQYNLDDLPNIFRLSQHIRVIGVKAEREDNPAIHGSRIVPQILYGFPVGGKYGQVILRVYPPEVLQKIDYFIR